MQPAAAASAAPPFSCQECGAGCDGAVRCGGCGALAFCCDAHRRRHCAPRGRHAPEDCARMASQLARGAALLAPPFAWCKKAPQQLCRMLAALGCHDAPAWSAACPLHGPAARPDAAPWLPAPGAPPAASARGDWERAWHVPADGGGAPAWRHRWGAAQPGAAAVASWAAHYAAAGLSPASPAALLLHAPLTLWHVLARVLPAHGRPLPPVNSQLEVFYLGARGELSFLPCFLETALLLPPGTRLSVHMIGPDVPPALDGRAVTWAELPGGRLTRGLTVALWHGSFHSVQAAWARRRAAGGEGARAIPAGAPHLVFAPNAGLPAFESWRPTLQLLAAGGRARGDDEGGGGGAGAPPFVATDYCEEAAHQSQLLLQALLPPSGAPPGAAPLAAAVNPFRCPVPAGGHGTPLPACGNALLFGWV
ncbi:hypothetical protein Rsub_11379 [Raphidocelis subcapitata]|uniref:Mitochondrial splicing suppressor 51-like C-terminal domain-containing protein n=1 Tax=Raphidocelis subcapitata TaxID=307507 RepID=A0A2V0PN27_9CHLO|nr:hypothetical protein Rsub_11379 [Raphidocelis subcapitata]|eukprot:GBF98797.1 hypothetical protein Rsub_11379 [Raphidocelis subcapitata]